MALTSPREVSSGYYRNQSYVLLGLCSLSAMASYYATGLTLWPSIVAAVLCYMSAVTWLYEKGERARDSNGSCNDHWSSSSSGNKSYRIGIIMQRNVGPSSAT